MLYVVIAETEEVPACVRFLQDLDDHSLLRYTTAAASEPLSSFMRAQAIMSDLERLAVPGWELVEGVRNGERHGWLEDGEWVLMPLAGGPERAADIVVYARDDFYGCAATSVLSRHGQPAVVATETLAA